MPAAFAIAYNQPIPEHVLHRSTRTSTGLFREPCLKIIAGDVDNVKLSFGDAVQAKRGQSTCSNYIGAHKMNLSTRRDGNDVYIIRRS